MLSAPFLDLEGRRVISCAVESALNASVLVFGREVGSAGTNYSAYMHVPFV